MVVRRNIDWAALVASGFTFHDVAMFEPAVEAGDRRIAFVREEVHAWVRARIAKRDGVTVSSAES